MKKGYTVGTEHTARSASSIDRVAMIRSLFPFVESDAVRQHDSEDAQTDIDVLALGFGVGDLVRCPYYEVTGTIVRMWVNERSVPKSEQEAESCMDPIVYVAVRDKEGNVTNTNLRHKSANVPLPHYLQLICKRDELLECMVHYAEEKHTKTA